MTALARLVMALRPTRPRSGEELGVWRWAVLVIFPLHLLVTAMTIGIRFEHVLMDATFIVLAWASPRLRRLSFYCLPMGLTAMAYDNLRFVTHLRGTIHVADLYAADLRWFGLDTEAGRIILPEYFRRHPNVLLDLVCGFAYLSYLYEIIGLGFYLYFRDESRMSRLAWGFMAVNLMGMATYLIYPAAPPWYVEQYGLGPAVLDAAPSAAGAARFDELLGISYFANFYARNINVFGAMPSLHVAYPVLVFCVVVGMGRAWAITTGLFALLVAFSAVYLRHHYVWDILMGALYGAVAYGAVSLVQSWLHGRSAAPLAGPVHQGEAAGMQR